MAVSAIVLDGSGGCRNHVDRGGDRIGASDCRWLPKTACGGTFASTNQESNSYSELDHNQLRRFMLNTFFSRHSVKLIGDLR